VFLSILTLYLLPNRPESTVFLNERERKLAIQRMNRYSSGDVGATVTTSKLVFC